MLKPQQFKDFCAVGRWPQVLLNLETEDSYENSRHATRNLTFTTWAAAERETQVSPHLKTTGTVLQRAPGEGQHCTNLVCQKRQKHRFSESSGWYTTLQELSYQRRSGLIVCLLNKKTCLEHGIFFKWHIDTLYILF